MTSPGVTSAGVSPDVTSWTRICPVERMLPDAGVAALVDGQPVAVFLLTGGDVYAIDAVDPFHGAMVLARGLIGSAGDVPYVASPLLKQRFSLLDGHCLDDDSVSVRAWQTRVVDGHIEVGAPTSAA